MKKFILTVVSIVILFVFHGCSPVSVFPVGGSVANSLANVVDGSGLSIVVNDSLGNLVILSLSDTFLIKVSKKRNGFNQGLPCNPSARSRSITSHISSISD